MSHFYKKCQNLSKNEGVLVSNEAQIETSKEQGRSMVEMLGVLAVVGVLSVGAISGYRYAMNKYRANQVTNELNLLSHQVAIAMMSKNGISGTLTLGESYDTNKKLTSSGYDIAFGCGDSGDDAECSGQNAFHFEVKNVSEDVCKKLMTSGAHLQYLDFVDINDGIGCRSGSENNIIFVFASDDFMSEERVSFEDEEYCNSNGKYDAKTNACVCDEGYVGFGCQIDTTCSGQGRWIPYTSYYEDGYCQCNDGYFGSSCQKKNCNGSVLITSFWSDCDCPEGSEGPNCECHEGQTWNGTYCANGEPQKCDNETPCPTGEYCFTERGYRSSDEFGSGENALKGRCRNVEAESFVYGEYVVSKSGMTWWSANRFCNALGKNLVSLSDISCQPTICFNGCAGSSGICHKEGTDGSLDAPLLKDVSDWPTALWSIRNAAYMSLGYKQVWTGTEGYSGQMYVLTLGDGSVWSTGKDARRYGAVCK